MYHLVIKPRAISMATSSYNWYEKQKKNLGEEFLIEVENKLKVIESNPYLFATVKKHYHQAPLDRFPFVLIYEIIKNTIVVYAIFHTSRNPNRKIN
jgi:plasmid stabilization system protein ParE